MPNFKFHVDGTLPENGEIFVFGSNLAGVHGAGAAKAALQFGAQLGRGIGMVGNTYAIPTKDKAIETLPFPVVKQSIIRFSQVTFENRKLQFFITRVGCGLAGFKDEEIAPLFILCNNNCSFPEPWRKWLDRKMPWHVER